MQMNHQIVLVVSEERAYGSLLMKSIEKDFPGLKVDITDCGENALKYMRESKVCLIITDFRLHGMGGLNLFYEIKKKYSDVKIILLYNPLDSKLKDRQKMEGLFGSLEKPFLMERLMELVRRVLVNWEGKKE